MQALILAGGEGTRLRPLTSTTPKPVVPLAGRPFISYMLDWLRSHGVREAILACGFMADAVRGVLGDGSALGIRLRYVEEPEPLGTGGALKYAEKLLEERFFMLNGDVLTDIDLTAQLRQHERTGARATLALVGVEDPSAYGLVRRRADASVTEFVEKPGPEECETNLINAGAYIIERELLGEMASAGTHVSIEREVFPALVDRGLYGYAADGYWLDIGTPSRYLQGTADILSRAVESETGASLAAAGGVLGGDGQPGRLAAPSLVGADCVIEAGATVGPYTVLGRGVTVAAGARVRSAVLLDGSRVGADSRVTDAVLGAGARVGERCRIDTGAMLGEGVTVGDDNVLSAGVRIFPGVTLGNGAVAF